VKPPDGVSAIVALPLLPCTSDRLAGLSEIVKDGLGFGVGVPLPADPLPVEPLPVEPLPAEPLPVEPLPAEPLPAEPLPVEPLPVEPLPVEPLPEDEVEPDALPLPEAGVITTVVSE
jgi:hypothetical protein